MFEPFFKVFSFLHMSIPLPSDTELKFIESNTLHVSEMTPIHSQMFFPGVSSVTGEANLMRIFGWNWKYLFIAPQWLHFLILGIYKYTDLPHGMWLEKKKRSFAWIMTPIEDEILKDTLISLESTIFSIFLAGPRRTETVLNTGNLLSRFHVLWSHTHTEW